MDQKLEFILHWKSKLTTFAQLCRDFGIARSTGYKYLKRYEENGMSGLDPLSTAPHNRPNKTPEEIEKRIIEFRGEKERWGAKKIHWKLEQENIYSYIPSISTIGNILKRNGLIPERKKRKRVEPRKPIFDPDECNQIWSADFKGKFKMGNGKYCHPLTICDSYSRYILAVQGMESPNTENSKPVFERVFKEYGLPLQLHTDNGAPFANMNALGRLTQLSVWLMELGVQPVFSDPASPQQNGRHERMHRELKAEACKRPGKTLRAQQRKFNTFVREYNEERPHEALGMTLPRSVHVNSERVYTGEIEEWSYPGDYLIKYICKNGTIRVGKKNTIYISRALIEKKVGLELIGNGIYRLYFREFLLGYIDENELKLYDIQEYMYIPRL